MEVHGTTRLGYGSKQNHQGTAGFSLWFHLPGFHFRYAFLTHSHFFYTNGTPVGPFPPQPGNLNPTKTPAHHPPPPNPPPQYAEASGGMCRLRAPELGAGPPAGRVGEKFGRHPHRGWTKQKGQHDGKPWETMENSGFLVVIGELQIQHHYGKPWETMVSWEKLWFLGIRIGE